MLSDISRPALRYYGGKFRLASWIISHFPEHVTYCEPFGGAAGVLLRKAPSPLEIYNDLCDDVVNFFRVLRERPRDLVRAIRLTPFSRTEFTASYQPTDDPVEQARRWFVRSWQGFGGPRKDQLTGWKLQTRKWISGRADTAMEWRRNWHLMRTANRLRGVQIEHDDGLRVIRRCDTPETLFYCDPPYPKSTRNRRWMNRGYTHEFSYDNHVHLANLLKQIKGRAIVSTYPCELYDELYAGWRVEQRTAQTMNKTIATEILYIKP